MKRARTVIVVWVDTTPFHLDQEVIHEIVGTLDALRLAMTAG